MKETAGAANRKTESTDRCVGPWSTRHHSTTACSVQDFSSTDIKQVQKNKTFIDAAIRKQNMHYNALIVSDSNLIAYRAFPYLVVLFPPTHTDTLK